MLKMIRSLNQQHKNKIKLEVIVKSKFNVSVQLLKLFFQKSSLKNRIYYSALCIQKNRVILVLFFVKANIIEKMIDISLTTTETTQFTSRTTPTNKGVYFLFVSSFWLYTKYFLKSRCF